MFWSTTKAYNETNFNITLKELKRAFPNAVEDFIAHNPRRFSKEFLRVE